MSDLDHAAHIRNAVNNASCPDCGPTTPEHLPASRTSAARLREELAALEHEQWEKWSRTIAEQGLTPERVERWKRYWVPYADLDEETKEFDRHWADLVLAILARLSGDKESGR